MKTKDQVIEQVSKLNPGNCILVSARKTKNEEKIQLEFAEIVVRKDRPINLISALNQTDSRFNGGIKPRRAWSTFQISEASKAFGIDFSKLEYKEEDGKQIVYIGKLPLIYQGQPVHLQVNETLEPTEYQLANLQTSAKSNGKGTYYLIDGSPIFSNVGVVAGKPNHFFIDHNEKSFDLPQIFDVVSDEEVETEGEEEMDIVEDSSKPL